MTQQHESKITPRSYFVYIVQCADNTLYTGITTDIKRRLREHNGVEPGGAKYTQARRPVSLVYSATSPDRSAAMREEYRIKHLPRLEKERLVLGWAKPIRKQR